MRPSRFYSHADDAGIASMSRDESLIAISHSEHGDSRHPALRVLAADGFGTVAEKWDGEGKGLTALEFSPLPGDQRLLVLHERRGREELLVWDVRADTETEIELDLPGEVVAGWYPDARALLVVHFHEGRSSLYRYHLDTAELSLWTLRRGASAGPASVRTGRSSTRGPAPRSRPRSGRGPPTAPTRCCSSRRASGRRDRSR